jgi:hypothetical protein
MFGFYECYVCQNHLTIQLKKKRFMNYLREKMLLIILSAQLRKFKVEVTSDETKALKITCRQLIEITK